MSTVPTQTQTPTPVTPTPASLLAVLVEWLAGELAKSPTILKLAGLGAVVAAAIPGDISNQYLRAALTLGGFALTAIVHAAETLKK